MGEDRTRLTCTLPEHGLGSVVLMGPNGVSLRSEMVTSEYYPEDEGVRIDTLVSTLCDSLGKDTVVSSLTGCYRKTQWSHL